MESREEVIKHRAGVLLDGESWLTPQEIAAHYDVHFQTVHYRMRKAGVRSTGGRYQARDVRTVMGEPSEPGTPEAA